LAGSRLRPRDDVLPAGDADVAPALVAVSFNQSSGRSCFLAIARTASIS
jgi:hypothetical protein